MRMAESPATRGLRGLARLHKPLCLEASVTQKGPPLCLDAESRTPASPDSCGRVSVGHARSRRNGGPDVGSGGMCPPSLSPSTCMLDTCQVALGLVAFSERSKKARPCSAWILPF